MRLSTILLLATQACVITSLGPINHDRNDIPVDDDLQVRDNGPVGATPNDGRGTISVDEYIANRDKPNERNEDSTLQARDDGPATPNPNDGRGTISVDEYIANRDKLIARNEETDGANKTSPNPLEKRACWFGRTYDCSRGYCYQRCGMNGEWCWLAADEGRGPWLTCQYNPDCSYKKVGVNTLCSQGNCKACGCSC